MNKRHPLAVIAGVATLLAALPLTSVYPSFTWLLYAALAIAVRGRHGHAGARRCAVPCGRRCSP